MIIEKLLQTTAATNKNVLAVLNKIERIMATLDDFQVSIDTITEQLIKVQSEVVSASKVQSDAIAVLQAEVANLQSSGVVVSPALQASLDNLQLVANQLDALNPDKVV